jgi:FkbM family methyltransferase
VSNIRCKTFAKHAAWRVLKWLHGRDVVPLRVLRGPARGATLNLDVRSQASYWIGNYDEYAFARLPFRRYLRAGAIAWDGGAFVGYYAAVFRKIVGEHGRVIVFEASSKNYAPLAALPGLNRWPNVEIRHEAIGADHCEIEFVANLGGASGPFGLSKQYAPDDRLVVERVPCRGVDELVFERGVPTPDFIKFDLESAEEFALHNGPRVFSEGRPVLLLELHGEAARDAAGRFLETYRYGATCVDHLAVFRAGAEARWLESLRARGLRSAAELRALPYLPHMLLTLPLEHADWATSR